MSTGRAMQQAFLERVNWERGPGWSLWLVACGILASLGIGLLAALQPEVALVALLLFGWAVVTLLLPVGRWSPVCLGSFCLIAGYVWLNRGFAGIHLSVGPIPVYVGEVGLLLFLLPAIRRLNGQSLGTPALLLGGWMLFNAALTLPQIPTHGLDAIRDAATWYYGLYVLIGAAAWLSLGSSPAPSLRRWLTVVFVGALIWIPASVAVGAGLLPTLEVAFSDRPLLGAGEPAKFDVAAMHLLGGAVLFLTTTGGSRPGWPSWSRLAMAGASIALVASLLVRAALIGLIGCLGLLLIYGMWRPVVAIVGALAILIALLWAFNIELMTHRGAVNAQTVVERQLSTINFVGNSDIGEDDQAGTIQWRVIWWRALLDEALNDPVILSIGRGYGPDLRESVAGSAGGDMNWDQGEESGAPVRSPHNIAMTLLARSGLVGLVLWLVVLVASYRQILRATRAASRARDTENTLLGRWFTIYLSIMLLVAMFGVVLEGPFGAVPFFWTLGMALIWSARLLVRPANANTISD